MSNEAIGDSIARRYRIIEKLGSGGMGSVYKALDTRFQTFVALKVLHFARNSEAKQLLLREAVALARLNHPNIVQIYEVGETETLAYLAFEYIEGRTLNQILATTKPLDAYHATEIISQVGSALMCAHQLGLIHRDIKPSNILISNEGRVLLLDFGLTTAIRAFTLSQSGTVVGTPAYMSPEQAMGRLIDGRSDIFSLGVVLYELLTGMQPFVGSSTIEVFRKVCEEVPKSPEEINPSVPSSIAEVVSKSLAKQPEQRFQTVDEFLSALIEANPRRDLFLSLRGSRDRESENENRPVFVGDIFPAAFTAPLEKSPTERSPKKQQPHLLRHTKPPLVPSAVGRGMGSRVIAAALAVSFILLISFRFVPFRILLRSIPFGSGSTSTARGSWFIDYGQSLLAVAGAALVLWLVLRLCVARTVPSQEVGRSPTVSAPAARLDRGVALQTDQAQQISLREMILQGGAGDRDPTAELLPYRPAPGTAERLQEFNDIWDQLTSAVRHAR